MFADSLVFKQNIYCSFLWMDGVGVSQNWSFVVVINVWPLSSLKLQPMQSLESAVSSTASSNKPDTFWPCREQLPVPPPHPRPPLSLLPSTPLMTKLKHVLLSASAEFFTWKKYFDLLTLKWLGEEVVSVIHLPLLFFWKCIS